MQNLKIDGERLWGELMETAAIGATAKGGICRLTLTDLDRQVRDWFKARAQKLGCTVTVDDMGAMFARRPGQRADVAPIAFGSHLDTQPTGGKFDGVLGVLGALEALRTLVEAGYETFAPIEVVNWTNEEGARFSPAMTSSGVFAGAFARDWAVAREDRAGETFGAALEAIGYRGPEQCGAHPLSAFFELHIEQGPILEAERKDIGIVTGVQGMRWYEAQVTGQDAHTGATPMHLRKNALIGAARLVERVDAIARKYPPLAVGTVGSLEVRPNSPNVVPGEVRFTVDFRHPETAVLDAMERAFFSAVDELCGPLGLAGAATRIWGQPPVAFDPGCIAAVREAAAQSGFSAREIVSGAGHDAAYVARVAPTAMIFVPCRDGISHNEAEFTSKEQCAAGAQVLLQAVLNYDRALAEGQVG
jgi:N-carbamoyl-L-amino-acid hydrolase